MFVPNLDFAEEFAASDDGLAVARSAAEAAKAKAEALSPQGATGQTARSFVVTEDDEGVYLGNTDPFFHLTEFGSVNNAAYAPLRRGVREAGLRLEESSKQ